MINGKKFLGVHLEPDFHKQVKTKAAEMETTMSQLVIHALAEYLGIDPPKEEEEETLDAVNS